MRNTVMAKESTKLIELQVKMDVLRRDIEFSCAARNIQQKTAPSLYLNLCTCF